MRLQVPFNEAPDMKAREITEAGKEALRSGRFKMVRVNFANPGTLMATHFHFHAGTHICCACE